jgi:hypothetical protein
VHPGEVDLPPLSYAENKFPKEYEPTVFDNLTTTLKIDNRIINLGLWYAHTHLGILQAKSSSDGCVRLHTPEPIFSSLPFQSSSPLPS